MLGTPRILFGTAWRNDNGAVWCDRLHGTLEGLEDAVALLPLFLLTGLNLPQLAAVIPHHLFPCVCQPPEQKKKYTVPELWGQTSLFYGCCF